MSLGDARVEIRLDAAQAERLLRDLLGRISRAEAKVTVTADARNVTPVIEGAINAADTGIIVTGDARDVTSEVEGAIDAADTGVEVTGDARDVTSSIEGAVDAADTGVVVTGDARDVTSSVEGAIDAADTGVSVTADASNVTSSVEGAVDAADTHVVATADASGLQDAAQASDALAGGMSRSVSSAAILGTTIAGIGIGALAKQIFDAAQAASGLEEATTKTQAVFRDSIGVVEEFGETAATSVALSRTEALDAAGTFGNLLVSMGQTRAEAAQLSPQIIQLATDFASFNNLNVDDTLVAIRSGLVGEIEPLRRLGVSFNAVQVEAKAMELGLADANGEVSEGAKVQARWALILEQSGNVQGDFARTSEGLANQQRQLSAEFRNAITEIGIGFLPLMKDLVTAGRDAIPAFVELATAAGPVLAETISALVPLFGTTTSLVVALSPALNALAAVIDAIPDPVLRIIAAFVALNRVLKLTGLTGVATSLLGVRTAGAGVLGVLGGLNPAIAVGAGLLTVWSINAQQAANSAAKAKAQAEGLQAALDGQGDRARETTEWLQDLVESEERLIDVHGRIERIDVAETLDRAGVSAGEFTRRLSLGNAEFSRWAERTASARGEGEDLVDNLEDLRAHMLDQADAVIASGVETGRWSERQVEAAREAVATGQAIFGSPVEALEVLTAQEEAAGEATDETTASFDAQRVAVESLAAAVPAVGSALGAVRVPGGSLTTEFTNLALAIDDANLSQEQLAVVAGQLGVPLADLESNVAAVVGVVDGFVSAVESAVPSIGQRLASLGEDVTFQGVRDEFAKTLADMQAFESNIALLAAFPNVQAAAIEGGPHVAAALAQGFRDGKTGALAEMDAQALGAATVQQRIIDQARDVYGPAFARQLAENGLGSTRAFTGTFKLGGHVTAQGDAAVRIIRSKQGVLEGASRDTGEAGASGFAAGVRPIPGTASARIGEARRALGEERDRMLNAGRSTGRGGAAGFTGGLAISADRINRIVRAWRTNIIRGVEAIFELGSPSRLLRRYGRLVGEGFIRGIGDNQSALQSILSSFGGDVGRFLGLLGGSLGPGPGGGVEQWRSVALAALRYTGQSAGWIGDLLTQMSHESGGNQFAINLNDINAQRGDPSRGLMQTIGATFNRFAGELIGRGIYDPFANIVAAIRYTLSRYGSLGAWRARGFAGYETGAWELPSDQIAGVHRGEMIVPAQFARAVRQAIARPTSVATTSTYIVNITVPPDTTDPFGFGRKVGRGFESTLTQRRIATDARIA